MGEMVFMADTTKLAAEILEMVGGAENVTFVAHCMTRLRFNLKDESIVDDAKVKAIDGVIDIRHSAGAIPSDCGAQGR